MFGKSIDNIAIDVAQAELERIIDCWAKDHRLVKVNSSCAASLRFRFGNPFVSNPIYIELSLNSRNIEISGWVQTLLFYRWKLIESKIQGIGTAIDYRRKGGYFVYTLKRSLIRQGLGNPA